jgi:phosphomevalonate kinase
MSIMTKVYGNNYSNLTPEERKAAWDKQFALQSSKASDYDYYDKVRSSKDIEQIKEHIKSIVDAIQQKMEEDCKMWQVSNEIRHLSSLRTHRGQMRFLKGAQGGADDAVAKYKNGIEALKEIVDEVRHNRPSTRNEQFIVFHASNLKTELMEQGHASIQ